MLRHFDVTTQMELFQRFKGLKGKHLLKSKAKTYQSLGRATRRWIDASSTR